MSLKFVYERRILKGLVLKLCQEKLTCTRRSKQARFFAFDGEIKVTKVYIDHPDYGDFSDKLETGL